MLNLVPNRGCRRSIRIRIGLATLAAPTLVLWLATGAVATVAQGDSAAAAPVATESAPSKPIEFDIAVFKKDDSGQPAPALSMPVGGDGLAMKNRPMRDLIRYAYTITSGATLHFQNQPAWVNSDRWDVQAKVADSDLAEWQKLNDQGHKIALRGFLTQYLKLAIHYDTQEYPCYSLEVGKGTPKLTEHKSDGAITLDNNGRNSQGAGWQWTGPSEMTANGTTMKGLAQMLSGHADRTVVDRTGLTGSYDFVLKFDTSDAGGPQGFSVPFTRLPPEISTPIEIAAIKEQLGLKLVSAKAPIEGVVIDHVERPPQN